MLNRCQSMSTIKGSVTSRRFSVTVESGGKRHRNAATPRREDYQARLRSENGPEPCGFTLEEFLQGEQVVEAPLLASGFVAVWMSFQS